MPSPCWSLRVACEDENSSQRSTCRTSGSAVRDPACTLALRLRLRGIGAALFASLRRGSTCERQLPVSSVAGLLPLLARTAIRPAANRKEYTACGKPPGVVGCADEAERRASGRGRQCRRRPNPSSSDHAMRGHERAEHNCEVRDQSNNSNSQERVEILVVEDPVEAPVRGIPRSVSTPDNWVAENVWGDCGIITGTSVRVVSLS